MPIDPKVLKHMRKFMAAGASEKEAREAAEGVAKLSKRINKGLKEKEFETFTGLFDGLPKK